MGAPFVLPNQYAACLRSTWTHEYCTVNITNSPPFKKEMPEMNMNNANMGLRWRYGNSRVSTGKERHTSSVEPKTLIKNAMLLRANKSYKKTMIKYAAIFSATIFAFVVALVLIQRQTANEFAVPRASPPIDEDDENFRVGPALKSKFCNILQVVDNFRLYVRFLKCDQIILGGIRVFDGSSAFRVFHIIPKMIQDLVAPKLSDQRRRGLCIGLGVGLIPRALENQNFTTDIVEIDHMVVDAAKQDFNFSSTGEMYVEDATVWLQQPREQGIYDVIVHDLFSGAITFSKLYSIEVFQSINRILKPNGIVVVNFVGFHTGYHRWAAESLYIKLKSVFGYVRVFRDEDPKEDSNRAGNLMYFAGREEIEFKPNTSATSLTAATRTIAWLEAHYTDWEIDYSKIDDSSNVQWSESKLKSMVNAAHLDIAEMVREYLP